MNDEIPNDGLLKQIRRWVASSEALRTGRFDLLQLAELVDGRSVPRADCGIFRTTFTMNDVPTRALLVLFYRARKSLNDIFWVEQVRKLCDIVAEEHFRGGRGVQLLVHHNAPSWALGLEVGNHRVLARLGAFQLLGSWQRWLQPRSMCKPELLDLSSDNKQKICTPGFERFSFQDFNTTVDTVQGASASIGSLQLGHYVLRSDSEKVICGVRVIGSLPWRLVCGSAWAARGHEEKLGPLLDALRRLARKPVCSLLGDERDPHWTRLCGSETVEALGVWHRTQQLDTVVTGVPMNLEPREQGCFAQTPFSVPFEFLPFHAGGVLLL